MEKTIILSLLGGGVRGLVTIHLIVRIIKEFPQFLDRIFLIIGTSIGAAIGAGLAFGIKPKDIESLLYSGTKHALKDSIWDDLKDVGGFGKTIGGLRGAEYSSKNMFKMYDKAFGKLKIGEAKIQFCATTYDLLSKRPKIFESLTGADDEFLVTDVITGSGAAPLAFDAWQVEKPKKMVLFDGGVFAVDPTQCGIAQARDPRNRNGVLDNSEMKILTIGTGTTKLTKRKKVDGDWGFIELAQNIKELLINSSTQITLFKTKQEYRENFHYLNPVMPKKIEMDDWKARDELLEIADNTDIKKTIEWLN